MKKPLLLILVAGSITAAATAHGQSAPTTIKAVQTTTAFKFVDVAPKGSPSKPFTAGDTFVIGGKLDTGGTINLDCVTTQPGRKGASACHGIVDLADGELVIGGLSRVQGNTESYAVTGGTDSYVGAAGTLVAKPLKGDKQAITITLTA